MAKNFSINHIDLKRRGLMQGATVTAIGVAVPGCGGGGEASYGNNPGQKLIGALQSSGASTTGSNVIVDENNLLGTTDWKLNNPVSVLPTNLANRPYACGDFDPNNNRCPTLEGFAFPWSANPGEAIKFYVSTTAPTYNIDIYRIGYYGGTGGRFMKNWSNLTVGGVNDPQTYPEVVIPPKQPSQSGIYGDCSQWKPAILDGANSFTVPSDWVSGFYVAKITESINGKQSYILFIITDHSRFSDILFQSAHLTYHRYNGWGGAGQYSIINPTKKQLPDGAKISFMRPTMPPLSKNGTHGVGAGQFLAAHQGNGTRAIVNTNTLPGPDSSPIESCSGWEIDAVRYLEKNGYDVKYCTPIEIAKYSDYLQRCRIHMDAGHDEYLFRDQQTNILNAWKNFGTHGVYLSGNQYYSAESPVFNGTDYKQTYSIYNISTQALTPAERYEIAAGSWTFGGTFADSAPTYITPTCPSFLLEGTNLSSGSELGNRLMGYEGDGLADKWLLYSEACSHMTPTFRTAAPLKGPNQHCGGMWVNSTSGAQRHHFGSINTAWALDDFNVEDNAIFRTGKESESFKTFFKNNLDHILYSKNFSILQKPSGSNFYLIKFSPLHLPNQYIAQNSNSSYSAPKINDFSQGTDQTWQFTWIDPSSAAPTDRPCAPFMAIKSTDAWFSIKNQSSGKYLQAYGHESGAGLGSDNGLFARWRVLVNNDLSAAGDTVLLQNVGTGGLMSFNNSNLTYADIAVNSSFTVNAVFCGGSVSRAMVIKRTASIGSDFYCAMPEFPHFKAVKISTAALTSSKSLKLTMPSGHVYTTGTNAEFSLFTEDLYNTAGADALYKSARSYTVCQGYIQDAKGNWIYAPGYGLKDFYLKFPNGKAIHPVNVVGGKFGGFLQKTGFTFSLDNTNIFYQQHAGDLVMVGKLNQGFANYRDINSKLYWKLLIAA